MDFPEASFDSIVDKATLDSVLVTLHLYSAEKIQLQMQIKWFRRYIEYLINMEFMLPFPMGNQNLG